MVERDTNRVGTPNGHTDSALFHLKEYIESSGFQAPLNHGNQQMVITKLKKDLEKIAVNGYATGGSEEPNIVVKETVLEAGNFKFFWEKDLVIKPNGEAVKLRPTESKVLYVLMSKSGRVVRPEEFRRIWPGVDMRELKGCLRTEICWLRERLEDVRQSIPGQKSEGWKYIKTFYGRGCYMWAGDVQDDSDHLLDAGF